MEKRKKEKRKFEGFEEADLTMTLEEATKYLKKLGEWESVVNVDRETIIKWAEFLLIREERKKYE